ncbi:phage tail-collar fiber domain-containing protein [Dickeya poaceiphila]|uniref:phage tail-collar fiber domain-containing protein n=3 Tax=Dickeya poaceiphila TaxID=568768 RepID=UPI0038995A63
MTTKYFALLTNTGAALLANATALGRQLSITQMALGDGSGTLPTPDPAQTKLVNERRRAPLNSLNVDPANPGQIIAEQVIPEDEGGWWIREIGLYDANGNLIAVANCPETYKPKLQEGSGRVQTVRMILIVSSTDAVTLKIDPSVVLATRKSVDDKAVEAKAHADGTMASHVNDANPHKQYAPIASPALTGVPTAPTVNSGNNSSQLATTAFVHNAIADNAFALDFTSRATGWDVPWDAKSGFYEAYLGSYSQAVLHFHGSASSCTALQFAARYGNGGLSYRTSRDDKGFEHDWEQIYTTGFRPSPADIGALSVAEFNQSIKSYAPIASPALTGVPTAPTVNSGNNSSQLATTAFVHNALTDNAFVLDFTGTVQNFDVPWDAKSGFYKADVGSHTDAVLHFHGPDASCSALQFAAHYGNGGLSYRTSRDSRGFEHDWEQIYTTGFRPSPADIGAISVSELTGIPLPWPQVTAPSGWLKCNGQAFDKNRYPRLAQVYPSGVLPDLRGEFIRGWDDGRGVDAGRAILSAQTQSIQLHTHDGGITGPATGVIEGYGDGSSGGAPGVDNYNPAATGAAGGAETRPRNIAFNYIVRAA